MKNDDDFTLHNNKEINKTMKRTICNIKLKWLAGCPIQNYPISYNALQIYLVFKEINNNIFENDIQFK